MPCDSVITISLSDLKFEPELLAKALQASGYQEVTVQAGVVRFGPQRKLADGRFDYSTLGVYTATNGLTITTNRYGLTSETAGNEVKRAYALESVKAAATRFGWQQPTQVKGKTNTFKVQQKLGWGK